MTHWMCWTGRQYEISPCQYSKQGFIKCLPVKNHRSEFDYNISLHTNRSQELNVKKSKVAKIFYIVTNAF